MRPLLSLRFSHSPSNKFVFCHSKLPLPLHLPCYKRRHFSATSCAREVDFTHAVIGGGVVGLAIARRLQMRGGGRGDTVLLEKHGMVGMETSSRNSEVIHAGLYYGTSSLKAQLCLKGKEMLYHLCKKHDIPHRNTGKWIVAQDATQMSALEDIHKLAKQLGVPTRFLSKKEARDREPCVRAEAGVLESSTTGIVDSHALMQFLQGDFENLGGICAFKSEITTIQAIDSGRGGWEITTRSPNPNINNRSSSNEEQEETRITASTIINSTGLSAIPLSNTILPPPRHKTPFFAKGSYFSYTKRTPRPSILIYPAPVPGHAGLGTHLTLDLAGRIRFGPDVEWTSSPHDYTPNTANLPAAIRDIQDYLPDVDARAVMPDYVGIRAKLGTGAATVGQGFQDFYIVKEEEYEGFVNLLGIESPGLTSCLAIAEMVEGLVYE